MPLDSLMTEIEVAKYLNVSVASIRRWRLLQRGPKFYKVGSLVRYRREDLEDWIRACPVGGERNLTGATEFAVADGSAGKSDEPRVAGRK